MKSGLYACAGASAIASAAACANRFDEPITNESNVYFGLIAAPSGRGTASTGGLGEEHRDRGGPHDELEPAIAPERVGHAGAHEMGEPALDLLAGEIRRDGEHERVVVERHRGHLSEPVPERLLVQGAAQPSRQVAPEGFGSRLATVVHAVGSLLRRGRGGGEDSTLRRGCS